MRPWIKLNWKRNNKHVNNKHKQLSSSEMLTARLTEVIRLNLLGIGHADPNRISNHMQDITETKAHAKIHKS